MARPPRHVLLARRSLLWPAMLALAADGIVLGTMVVAHQVRRRRTPARRVRPTVTAPVDVDASTVTTYNHGGSLFEDMLSAINGAQRTVYFETFIWKDDRWGHVIKEALTGAARRGVRVHVVYDGLANLVVPPAFFRFPSLPTLHVLRFPAIRPGLLTLNPRRTGRDHRKILVVDGHTAFTGGFNIGSLYQDTWRDTHVRLEGASAREVEHAFIDFWNAFRRRRHPALKRAGTRAWDAPISVAVNTPNRLLFPVRALYLDAIDRSQSTAYLTQGYFLPDRDVLTSLVAAARRGVDVRVLIPEVSNHVLADWVARCYRTELLEAGVRLFLFRQGMLHAKTGTVDGRWTTIGSANLDRLSLLGNYEVNVEVHDAHLAEVMENMFHTDVAGAREVSLAQWRRRGVLARIGETAVRPFRALI